MPGKVIGKVMNYGYPGTVSRSRDAVIDTFPAKVDIEFGAPVVLNSDGTVSPFGASDTAAKFIGFAVRAVKQAYNLDGDAHYAKNEPVDVLTRGTCTVHCAASTPVQQSAVYIQKVAETGVAAVGDITGTASSTAANSVALTNAVWAAGHKDAYGNAEATVLSRHI